MSKPIRINRKRLLKRLDELAKISGLDKGHVSRLSLTEVDKAGRDQVVAWMKELELPVHIDQVGNIIGVYPGEEDIQPIFMGSHIDTVTIAGPYDGSYGVLAAIEIIHTLKDRMIKARRPLVAAAYTNEEGVRFNRGMLGSSVYVGDLSVAEARAFQGVDGTNFGDELDRSGYRGAMVPGKIRPYAFLELHIEQGPILDRLKIPIGVVETVTGITWLEIAVTGAANHAGTTPLDQRRDAGLAAAKIITKMREIAAQTGDNQRATCGMIAFEPNAINVIPRKVVFTVDLRNPDGEALVRAEKRLMAFIKEVEASDGVKITIRDLEHVLPVEFDAQIVKTIELTAKETGIPSKRMYSGAGHDAQLFASLCPTGMIFVPSKDGISHSPDEYTSPEDLEKGANVMLETALKLANQGTNRENT